MRTRCDLRGTHERDPASGIGGIDSEDQRRRKLSTVGTGDRNLAHILQLNGNFDGLTEALLIRHLRSANSSSVSGHATSAASGAAIAAPKKSIAPGRTAGIREVPEVLLDGGVEREIDVVGECSATPSTLATLGVGVMIELSFPLSNPWWIWLNA